MGIKGAGFVRVRHRLELWRGYREKKVGLGWKRLHHAQSVQLTAGTAGRNLVSVVTSASEGVFLGGGGGGDGGGGVCVLVREGAHRGVRGAAYAAGEQKNRRHLD